MFEGLRNKIHDINFEPEVRGGAFREMGDDHAVGDSVVLVDDDEIREALGDRALDHLLDRGISSPHRLRVRDDARQLLHESDRTLYRGRQKKEAKLMLGPSLALKKAYRVWIVAGRDDDFGLIGLVKVSLKLVVGDVPLDLLVLETSAFLSRGHFDGSLVMLSEGVDRLGHEFWGRGVTQGVGLLLPLLLTLTFLLRNEKNETS